MREKHESVVRLSVYVLQLDPSRDNNDINLVACCQIIL